MFFCSFYFSVCDTFTIYSIANLSEMSSKGGPHTFLLASPIDFSGYNGGFGFQFHGVFNGNGFSFTNVNLIKEVGESVDPGVSIFGELSEKSSIKNLIISRPKISYQISSNKESERHLIGVLAQTAFGLDIQDVQIVDAEIVVSNKIDSGYGLPKLVVGGAVAVMEAAGNGQGSLVFNLFVSVKIIIDFDPTKFIYGFGYHYFGGAFGTVEKALDANFLNIRFNLNQTAPYRTIAGGLIGRLNAANNSVKLNNTNIVFNVSALQLLTIATIAGKMGEGQTTPLHIQNVKAVMTNMNPKLLQTDCEYSVIMNKLSEIKMDINASAFEILNFTVNKLGVYPEKSNNYLKSGSVNGTVIQNYEKYPVEFTPESLRFLDFQRSWQIIGSVGDQQTFKVFYKGEGILPCSESVSQKTSGINSYCSAVILESEVLGYQSICKDGYMMIDGYCRISGCFIVNQVPCGDESRCKIDFDKSISFCSILPEGVSSSQTCSQCMTKSISCTNNNGSVQCGFVPDQNNENCQSGYGGQFCEIQLCQGTVCQSGAVTHCPDCIIRLPTTFCFWDQSLDVSFCTDNYCEEGLFFQGCRACQPNSTLDNELKTCRYTNEGTFIILYDLTNSCKVSGSACAPNAFCDNFLQCRCRSGYVSNESLCVPSNCSYINGKLCGGDVCTLDTSQTSCRNTQQSMKCENCKLIQGQSCNIQGNQLTCSTKDLICQPGYVGPYCQICQSCASDVSKCEECKTTDQYQCVSFSSFEDIHMCPPNSVCQQFYEIQTLCMDCVESATMSSGKCQSRSTFIGIVVGSIIGVLVFLVILIVLIVLLVKQHKKNKRPERSDRSKNQGKQGKSVQDQYSNIVNNWMDANNKNVKRGQRAVKKDDYQSSQLSGQTSQTGGTDLLTTSRNPRNSQAHTGAGSKGRGSGSGTGGSVAGEDGAVSLTRKRGVADASRTSNARGSQGDGSVSLTRGRVVDANVTSTRGRQSDILQSRGRQSTVDNRGSQGRNVEANRGSDTLGRASQATRTRGSVKEDGNIQLTRDRGSVPKDENVTSTRGRGNARESGTGRRE